MLLTTGERVAMALLAMALHDLGVEAISFTGSQSGILTDGAHRAARIVGDPAGADPRRARARAGRDRRRIPGRQPRHASEITTLGRGGSDTTAVALAAALGPARCEI